MAQKEKNDGSSRYDLLIAEIAGKRPQSKEIITAFKPLFLAKEKLLEDMKVKAIDPSLIDGEELNRGLPCVAQAPFFFEDDPWEDIALALTAAIGEGFPALCDDAARLEGCIRRGEVRLFEFFRDFPAGIEAAGKSWPNVAGGRAAAGLLLSSLTRVVLEARSRSVRERLAEARWEKGYCPLCGAHPTIAVIREKITQRWLHCSRCGHEWRFNRMACPGCGEESPKGVDYFYVEDRVQETAFTCGSCNRYLITLNHISDIGDYDRDLTAMSLVHLDILMQEKGFVPLAWCGWNVFHPPEGQSPLC